MIFSELDSENYNSNTLNNTYNYQSQAIILADELNSNTPTK